MDNEKLLQLEGAVEAIVFRNEQNGYTVIEISDEDDYITAVGIMPQINAGDMVRLTGTYTNHPSYGRQFSAQACEISRPTETADILRYLSSGAVKGVGASTARKLVEAFGESTLQVMETEPERIATIKGITLKKAQEISGQLMQNTGIRTLMLYLGEYGISNTSAVKIFNSFGPNSIEIIKSNPYELCYKNFGVSFENADFIAKKELLENDSPIRLRAGIIYVLKHNESNGHTCLPKVKLISTTADFLKVEKEKLLQTAEEMAFERTIIEDEIEGQKFVFTHEVHLCEAYSASRVRAMLSSPAEPIRNIEDAISRCENDDGIEYAALQKEAITEALTQGMLVLTGGPGTGKTTTLNAIIKIMKRNGRKVLLSAPTGRAAQRMSEVTGDEAKTIHRLLEVSWDNQDNPVFNKNERNQLKCDALIVDEVSMVDTYIFESLMRAIPIGCRLILVGDSDQLPSVGPGNVLGDLISSEAVPVVTLNEIFRQAQQSLIVTNAHKIVSGQMPVLNTTDKDFFFIQRNNKTDAVNTILELCLQRLPKAYGYSAFDNIQVLCPSKKGELGTAELNFRLQNTLNPKSDGKDEITLGNRVFRVGDKVMQVKNNYDISWTKPDGEVGEGVFNGDIGIIESINKKMKFIKINFGDRTAAFSYENASDLDFAYAITVHKSQGNEFDAVIIPVFPGTPRLYYRNLLYTAVTRAKKTLILVGLPYTVEQMVQNNRRTKRYSGLKTFLLRDNEIF